MNKIDEIDEKTKVQRIKKTCAKLYTQLMSCGIICPLMLPSSYLGQKRRCQGRKKDCYYLTVIDGRVLDKLGEDKIKRVAGGIN